MAHQGYDGEGGGEHDPPQGHLDTGLTPTGGCSRESSAMGESLTERRRVQDEGLRIVNCFYEGTSTSCLTVFTTQAYSLWLLAYRKKYSSP